MLFLGRNARPLANPVNSLESRHSLIEHTIVRKDSPSSIDDSTQSAMNYLTGSNDTLHSRALKQQSSSMTTWKTCSRSDKPSAGILRTDPPKSEPKVMRRTFGQKDASSRGGSKSKPTRKSTADVNNVAKAIVDTIQREKRTTRSRQSSARSLESNASTTTIDSYHSTMPSLTEIAPRRPRTGVAAVVGVGALQAQTFDTSHLPPPPLFHRKGVTTACSRINTINLHVLTGERTAQQPIGEATTRISANCVIRRA